MPFLLTLNSSCVKNFKQRLLRQIVTYSPQRLIKYSVTGPLMLQPYDSYHMRRECRGRFPRQRPQGKPLVCDPGMHNGRCVTHVPWCMSWSLTRGGGGHVPGIPGAYAILNFTYLAGGPYLCVNMEKLKHVLCSTWNISVIRDMTSLPQNNGHFLNILESNGPSPITLPCLHWVWFVFIFINVEHCKQKNKKKNGWNALNVFKGVTNTFVALILKSDHLYHQFPAYLEHLSVLM